MSLPDRVAPEAQPVEPAAKPRPSRLTLAARREKPARHLADLAPDERKAWLGELGEKPMRATQLATHYFAHLTSDPAEMTDLPAATREHLAATALPHLLTPLARQVADGGATVKSLFALAGGARVETVLMAYQDRATVCVSSQAGCGMACPFCATGQLGLLRNLSAAEIVEQVRLAARAVRDGDVGGFEGAPPPPRLSNVVFMGMGEPLVNYRALLTAVRATVGAPPAGLGLSARNLTVSTCGIVPGIEKLGREGLPLRLALSLHAPDDALRDELVPVNRQFPVETVLDAARAYSDVSGRRVSIEYALIKDVNDQPWRADRLAKLLNRRGSGWAHVNPIPLNHVPGSRWTASLPGVMEEFVGRLRAGGIPTTIRDTRGAEIDGACGQLAAEETRSHG